MVTNGDEEMTEIPEDWEPAEGKESIFDLDEIDYDQYLLGPNAEEEQLEEESTEPSSNPSVT